MTAWEGEVKASERIETFDGVLGTLDDFAGGNPVDHLLLEAVYLWNGILYSVFFHELN